MRHTFLSQSYHTRRRELLEEYRDYIHKIDDYKWTVYTTGKSVRALGTQAAQALHSYSTVHSCTMRGFQHFSERQCQHHAPL